MTDWTVAFIEVALATASGLRVGGARTGDETDLPLLRDERGPFVPGSSLKGVLRSGAERWLRGFALADGVTPPCDVLTAPCGGGLGADEALPDPDDLCWVCQTFGSPHWGARLGVEDLVPAEQVRTVVRDGVGIDRDELRAKDGLKYDYEVMPPGTVLAGRLRLDDDRPGDLGLVASLLDLVDAGLLLVGGGTSRGLGHLRYHRPPTATRLRASAFLPGAAPEAVDLDAERAAARDLLTQRRTP